MMTYFADPGDEFRCALVQLRRVRQRRGRSSLAIPIVTPPPHTPLAPLHEGLGHKEGTRAQNWRCLLFVII